METKVIQIIIENNKVTKTRLKERGFFSDDPQFLFNTAMVLSSGRSMILSYRMHDMEKTEAFLVREEIPYKRIIRRGENTQDET